MYKNSRGQGSLEYLMLLGAGALVALIVFLLLIFLGPYGGGLIEENVEEYEKIDLCTASNEASCSLLASWNEGLKDYPSGLMLTNTSSWRTLVVHGITFSINCEGGVSCKIEDFVFSKDSDGNPIPPTIFLTWPTSTPITTLFDMCDGSGCNKEYSFPYEAGFELAPGESKELVVNSVSNLTNFSLLDIQFAMHVVQKYKDVYYKDSVDYKAEKLSWYSAYPYQIGPTYQCNLPPSGGTVDNGCVIPPGCIVSFCPADSLGNLQDDGSALYDYCSSTGLSGGDYVCGSSSGNFSSIACTEGGVPNVNTTPDADPYEMVNGKGAVLSIDVSSLKNAYYLDDFPPVFRLNVYKFADNGSGFDCSDDVTCDQVCKDDFELLFNNLDFYWGKGPGVSISDYGLMCAELKELDDHFTPLITTVKKVQGVYFEYSPGDYLPRCAATISFWEQNPALQDFANTEASTTNLLQIGMRSNSTESLKIESPLTTTQDSFNMNAFYKS